LKEETMTRVSKQDEALEVTREAMVEGILEVLERTYVGTREPEAVESLEQFFETLDDTILRAITYQHGLFEPDLEVEREDGDLSAE
jgi:hypothetical protein